MEVITCVPTTAWVFFDHHAEGIAALTMLAMLLTALLYGLRRMTL